MTETAGPQVVTLRSRQRWAWLPLLGAGTGFAVLHYTVASNTPVSMALLWLALASLYLLRDRRFAVILTPDELVRRSITARRIPWSEIQEFEVGKNLAGRYVLVRTTDGQRHQLPRPSDSASGDRFQQQLELIEQYWREHRGPGWRAAPAPSAKS